MESLNQFKVLPIELSIEFFRNFFTYDEKVRVLKDDYFWPYLCDSYAWREKPKISLKALKGASKYLLNEIESGVYLNRRLIYKVLNNTKKGIVTIETFVHVADTTKFSCTQPKVITKTVPINKVKSSFNFIKSGNILKNDIFTDVSGNFMYSINAKHIENFEMHTLIHISKSDFFIYRKERYFVLIRGSNGKYSNTVSFSCSDLSSNSELLLLIYEIQFSSCNKIIIRKNYIACKMIPWKQKYKCIHKTTFNYMLRKKNIKVISRSKKRKFQCKYLLNVNNFFM